MSRSKTYEVHRQKDMTLMLAFVHILQLQAGLHDRVASAEAAISLADAQAGERRALAQAALDVVEAKMAATEAEKADLDRQEAEANKVSRQAHEHAMSWMVGRGASFRDQALQIQRPPQWNRAGLVVGFMFQSCHRYQQVGFPSIVLTSLRLVPAAALLHHGEGQIGGLYAVSTRLLLDQLGLTALERGFRTKNPFSTRFLVEASGLSALKELFKRNSGVKKMFV